MSQHSDDYGAYFKEFNQSVRNKRVQIFSKKTFYYC